MNPETMRVYELGSASEATGTFVFFLVLSFAVAAILYAVMVRPTSRQSVFQELPGVRNSLATLASMLLFGAVFGAVYATLLRGFYRVEVRDEAVRLHYLFPSRTVTLSREELSQVERVAAHRDRWHLWLRTRQGTTYRSALAREPAARETWEGLQAYLSQADSP